MARFKQPYTLIKRKHKKGIVYYYRLAEDPRRIPHSTGQTLKHKAREYVETLLKMGPVDVPTLREYATDFFDWNNSPYLQRRNELKQGQKISPAVARNRHSNVHVYLIPKFGDTKLNRITLAVFEDWLFKLPLSNSTKNHLLYTMRLIMKEAVRRGVIKDNPLEGIEPLDPACKTRDYLRIDELNRLFPKDVEEFAKLWGKDTGFGMTLLIAASGGLRSGELRALRWRHVVWETGGILVMRARKRIVGEGTPKANSVRGVLLPQRTLSLLHWWYEENNQPGPEVYISPVIGANSLLRAFRRGMEKANINTTGRYLDVHSLRHTYNTQMRGLLEESKLMAFTGHKSIKMLEHYDQKTVAEKLQRRAGLRGQVDQFFSE